MRPDDVLPAPESEPDRRRFLREGILATAAAAAAIGAPSLLRGQERPAPAPAPSGPRPAPAPPFELEEASVADLARGMASGQYTAAGLTAQYLQRIESMDRSGPKVNAVIETNPDAAAIAGRLDDERKAGKVRGPLHGIPILIKDNIDTADQMRTSAGSLALGESRAPRDSGLVERLRAAGCVLIGKTNLSEWANFRSFHSSSGWSGRGGQTRNPYALDRNPCGSSSGTGAGIAANFAAIGIGTETDGSIVCPSSANGLVGIKPTVGLVSRAGIIPISASQDTAGPMCRSVADAAALLGAIAGADPRDHATTSSHGHVEPDYTKFLDAAGLKGARIGVARKYFGFSLAVDKIMDEAIAALKHAGATIVDPADMATTGKYDDAENDVLQYEFKVGIADYLAALGPAAPHKTLADLIAFNDRNRDREMPWFGQEVFLASQKRGPLTEAKYKSARAKCVAMSRGGGIDAALAHHKLDALVAPTGGPAWTTDLLNGDHFAGGSSSPAAVAGYASLTVPAGHIFGLPVGLSFIGGAWSEGKLIRLAYAYEQETKVRRAPRFLATADGT
jgi:amidase